MSAIIVIDALWGDSGKGKIAAWLAAKRGASQKLGIPPANCVVLEDAEKGVIAARAAGMKCIAVPNRHTKGNDLSKATLVVSGLDQVTLAMIESLDVRFD
jgi:beta-phosphoglucomutase-like phosphatase (HAD superfamily)